MTFACTQIGRFWAGLGSAESSQAAGAGGPQMGRLICGEA
jgi:hypothetical protein